MSQRRTCVYYEKGYCGHGKNCRYAHIPQNVKVDKDHLRKCDSHKQKEWEDVTHNQHRDVRDVSPRHRSRSRSPVHNRWRPRSLTRQQRRRSRSRSRSRSRNSKYRRSRSRSRTPEKKRRSRSRTPPKKQQSKSRSRSRSSSFSRSSSSSRSGSRSLSRSKSPPRCVRTGTIKGDPTALAATEFQNCAQQYLQRNPPLPPRRHKVTKEAKNPFEFPPELKQYLADKKKPPPPESPDSPTNDTA